MTRRRADEVRLQQMALLLRSAELRLEVATQGARLQTPLAVADRVREGWDWLRAHPEVPIAAAVVIAVLRPRRAWRWGVRLWWGWRSWRRLQRQLSRVR
jgi:hypothetical protein